MPADGKRDNPAWGNRVIEAMTGFEINYASTCQNLPFDPTHLANTTIADPALSAAVLLAWHEMHEPGISDTLAFEADADLRFAKLGLGFEASTPALIRQASAEQPPLNQPPQRAQQLWKRFSAETINLADYEVLEAVLAPVVAPGNTWQIAQALLLEFETFGQVIHAAAADLMAIEGLGEAGVIALKTVGAAALHMLRKAIDDAPRIRMWDDLIRYVIARLQHERVEVFFCIFLDSASRLIADEELGRGTIDRVAVQPREIIRRCLAIDATGIVLVHNHPTGTLEASRKDIEFTQDVVRAAKLMAIAVHDHVIVGNGQCFSFRANKLLDG